LKIDVVIPVFNEERTLEEQISKLTKFLDSQTGSGHQFRIIVADNGSTDKTKSIAEKLMGTFEIVSLVVVGVKGVGLALRKAWECSEADIFGYMDLDLATNLKHLTQVIDLFSHEKYDVINASRLLPGSSVKGRSVLRSFTSKALNLVLRMMFKINITDGMCGFKFFKRELLKNLTENGAKSDGWFFATQLLIISEMTGLVVKEIPVDWVDDGNSKVKVFKLSTQYLKEIILLRRYIRNSKFRNFVRL
jgi:glycosyltransferase involved in cell wall biosynthesis